MTSQERSQKTWLLPPCSGRSSQHTFVCFQCSVWNLLPPKLYHRDACVPVSHRPSIALFPAHLRSVCLATFLTTLVIPCTCLSFAPMCVDRTMNLFCLLDHLADFPQVLTAHSDRCLATQSPYPSASPSPLPPAHLTPRDVSSMSWFTSAPKSATAFSPVQGCPDITGHDLAQAGKS